MKNIYLIDDQSISNFITKKILEFEGFPGNIKDFTDPIEAFQSLIQDENALVFLDLNMPEMNGWEFMDALMDKNKQHRIIILTSSTSEIDRKKAREYPFVIKYMEKPMNKKKLSELSEFLITS